MTDVQQSLKSEWGSLTSSEFQSNEKWWPNALNLRMLHQSHPGSSPFEPDFDYRKEFAGVDVDALTRDVPYVQFADYLEAAFARRGGAVHTVLDFCCGTGTLSCLLARRGYELICTDGSADMLSVFREKCDGLGEGCIRPLLLCQEAAALDLFGTVDAAFCSLDGFNYLERILPNPERTATRKPRTVYRGRSARSRGSRKVYRGAGWGS